MQIFQLMITERLRAELNDFDVSYPNWLTRILDDDVYYIVTVIVLCANSFGLGMVLGGILTLL
jgi:hypothetical protein